MTTGASSVPFGIEDVGHVEIRSRHEITRSRDTVSDVHPAMTSRSRRSDIVFERAF